jgi:hypothetical protein
LKRRDGRTQGGNDEKHAAAAALIALALPARRTRPPREEASARAQTRFAQLTEGRVAGPPQSCVSLRNLHGNESAGEGAIIFRTARATSST